MSSSSSDEEDYDCDKSYKECMNTRSGHLKTREALNEHAKKCNIKNPESRKKFPNREALCRALSKDAPEPKDDDDEEENEYVCEKLDKYKVVELKAFAKQEGFTGYSKMLKDELVQMLKKHCKKKGKGGKTESPKTKKTKKKKEESESEDEDEKPKKKKPSERKEDEDEEPPKRKEPSERKESERELTEEEMIIKEMKKMWPDIKDNIETMSLNKIREKIDKILIEKGYNVLEDKESKKKRNRIIEKEFFKLQEEESDAESEAPPPKPKTKVSKKTKHCEKGKILNPKTGRCVKEDGPVGRQVLADQKKKGKKGDDTDVESDVESEPQKSKKKKETPKTVVKKKKDKDSDVDTDVEDEPPKQEPEKPKKKKVQIVSSKPKELREDDIIKSIVKIIKDLAAKDKDVTRTAIKKQLEKININLTDAETKKLSNKALEIVNAEDEEEEDEEEIPPPPIIRSKQKTKSIPAPPIIPPIPPHGGKAPPIPKRKEQPEKPVFPKGGKSSARRDKFQQSDRYLSYMKGKEEREAERHRQLDSERRRVELPPPQPFTLDITPVPPRISSLPPSERDRFPSSNNSIEDILNDIQVTSGCNPLENVYCDDDMVCDVTNPPGTCIMKETADTYKLEEMEINGFKVVGTASSLSLLKDELRKQEAGKEEEKVEPTPFEPEIIDDTEKISDVYSVGDMVLYMHTFYSKVESIDDVLRHLLLSFPGNEDMEDVIASPEDISPPLEGPIDMPEIEKEDIEDDEEKELEDMIKKKDEEEELEDMIRKKDEEEAELEEEDVELEEEEPELEEEAEASESEDEEEVEGRIKVDDVPKFLNEIEDMDEDDLYNIDIVNNQVMKCLGLMS